MCLVSVSLSSLRVHVYSRIAEHFSYEMILNYYIYQILANCKKNWCLIDFIETRSGIGKNFFLKFI